MHVEPEPLVWGGLECASGLVLNPPKDERLKKKTKNPEKKTN
jgi:hypothetical protein